MTKSYISEPYEFFLTQDSIDLLKRVVQEVGVFVRQVLIQLLEFISKGLVSLVVFLLLFVVDAKLASIVFLVLGGSYASIFVFKRKLLQSLGQERVDENRVRFKALSDLMEGIKEIQLYDARPFFFQRFHDASKRISAIAPKMHLLSVAPRHLVETLAYGGILLVTLYLLEFNGSVEEVIPVLSLYALSGYRLIPSLQGTFQAATIVRHSWPVVDEIIQDYNRSGSEVGITRRRHVERLPFEDTLSFKDVSFAYASEEESTVLRSISFDIKRGGHVAFVGRTGSGKTTLVDILTGLLAPTSGDVVVDDITLTDENRIQWQQQIGYVTQELFLFDDTVTRNIAFGIPDEEIDLDRVIEAARVAQAHEFVTESLQDGYNTVVGERGVRLSGGQRIRLGLARALYRNPAILILDEATSALDGITERAIIDELVNSPSGLTLILIAHRMSTVKACDSIFLLENGAVSDAGTYSDLLKTSDTFSEMRELTS